jgi:hypothetical protein
LFIHIFQRSITETDVLSAIRAAELSSTQFVAVHPMSQAYLGLHAPLAASLSLHPVTAPDTEHDAGPSPEDESEEPHDVDSTLAADQVQSVGEDGYEE